MLANRSLKKGSGILNQSIFIPPILDGSEEDVTALPGSSLGNYMTFKVKALPWSLRKRFHKSVNTQS